MDVTHEELSAAGGAALVGFEQAGSGAVLRNVDQKLKEVSVSPEDFGAVGDGVTNDTDAFLALSQFINAAGGGVIDLSPKTYVVGKQSSSGDALVSLLGVTGWRLKPHAILFFYACTKPILIRGNGAKLVCASGLKFGTFDASGNATTTRQAADLASPYYAMVYAGGCSGLVTVENLELDGNVAGHVLGGGYGDDGWQIPCTGIELNTCTGGFRVENVHSHRHGVDGLILGHQGLTEPTSTAPGLVLNTRCEENCRNNLSVVGGRNYLIANSKFNRSGRASGSGVVSNPGAGIDIEAESGVVRALRFLNCEAIDNRNVALVADAGDSAGTLAIGCRFVGTTSFALWPNKPDMKFVDCEILGGIVNTYGDTARPERATHFVRCRFTDRQSESPTGVLYPGAGDPIAQSIGDNTRFTDCAFDLTGGHLRAPLTQIETRYENVILKQTSSAAVSMLGRFSGECRFSYVGAFAFGPSTFHGPYELNGTRWAATPRADPASATTPGSVVGKVPFYSESGTLLGYAPLYNSIS